MSLVAEAPIYRDRVDVSQQQLRAFLVLADELNFRRAAERLYVSQPALSSSIKQLERTIGVQLLTRDTRHVALTPAGADFVGKLRPAMQALDDAIASAGRWADGTEGLLRIGYLIGAGMDRLPRLLRDFAERHPGIRVEILEFDFSDPSAGLASRSVDLAVIQPPIDVDDIELAAISEEGWVACLPHDHRLARRRKVRLAEVLSEPIIAAPSSAGSWRDYWIAQQFREHEVQVSGEAATFEAEFTAVAQGRGISITSTTAARYYRRPGVAFVPIADAPSGTVALAWPSDSTSPAVRYFVEMALADL